MPASLQRDSPLLPAGGVALPAWGSKCNGEAGEGSGQGAVSLGFKGG